MYIPQNIVDAVRQNNIDNPPQQQPVKQAVKKVKNSSVSGAPIKPPIKQEQTASNKGRVNEYKKRPTEQPTKAAPATEKRQPAPIKWRTRNISTGEHIGGELLWAYKRNYKVEVISSTLSTFPFTVYEITDPKKPKVVLKMVASGFSDLNRTKERCENIIRVLGRGLDLRLTDFEKSTGEYHPENCQFVPYEEATPKTTEQIRVQEAEAERILKEKLAKMNLV